MRAALAALLLLATSCSPDVVRTGPARYAVSGCRSMGACYVAAMRACGRKTAAVKQAGPDVLSVSCQ